MISEEELVRIEDPEIPGDCEIYEVFVDGRLVGFLVMAQTAGNTVRGPVSALDSVRGLQRRHRGILLSQHVLLNLPRRGMRKRIHDDDGIR